MAFSDRFFARSVSLLLLLAPTVGLSAPAALGPALACGNTGIESTAASFISDIDYPAINQLLSTESHPNRLVGLAAEIKKLELSRAPEAGLVKQRLQLALAQSYMAANLSGPAILALKSLPVSSPQAPEALMLLAELEVRNGRPKAAIRWLRQMAELYPDEALTIRGLWRAAELNHPHSRQALALWQQAAQQADVALGSALSWHERSRHPDFLDKINSEKLSPELWRLSRTVLTDPAFASANSLQAEVRRQLQCLSAHQDAQLRRMEKNPRLLADLNDTVETLTQQLNSVRSNVELGQKELTTLQQRLQECESRRGDCSMLADEHRSHSHTLARWRERAQDLNKKISFLRHEEKSLRAETQGTGTKTATVTNLADKLSNTKAFLQSLLQQNLATAVQDWEALSAEAHYRLAVAQQPRIQPGLVPPKSLSQ